MNRSRSPIYQTFSTRVLVVKPRRSRRWIALGALAVALLAVLALVLGRGFAAPAPQAAEQGAPVAESPADARGDLVRSYADKPALGQRAQQGGAAPAPAAPATPAAGLLAGAAQVAGTEGVGLRLRPQPSIAATIIKTLPDGAQVRIIGDEIAADGLVWAPVQDDTGAEGWVAVDYLRQL